MTDPILTAAQRDLLRTLPERIPPTRIDRLWLFAARVAKARESGLVVLSLFPEDGERADQRTLLTLRYQAEMVKGRVQRQDEIAEEGSAPPERIERIIAGVLARDSEDGAEPMLAPIDGQEERWLELLERLAVET